MSASRRRRTALHGRVLPHRSAPCLPVAVVYVRAVATSALCLTTAMQSRHHASTVHGATVPTAVLFANRNASTCWVPSPEPDRLRAVRARHVGLIQRTVERIGRRCDLAVEEPCAPLVVVAERDEVGPVCTECDTVLHGKVAALDREPVVAVLERTALPACVGAHHYRVVARREPAFTVYPRRLRQP